MKEVIKFKAPRKRKSSNNWIYSVPVYLLVITAVTAIFSAVLGSVLDHDVRYYVNKANSRNEFERTISIEDSVKFPGTIETIAIKADPLTKKDNVALLRLKVEKARVLDFTPAGDLLALGACENGLLFTDTEVCADIAKSSYFTTGDLLGYLKVQWSEFATASISTTTGHGYYNGEEVSAALPLSANYEVSGELPLTGAESVNNSSLLLIAATAVIFVTVVTLFVLSRKNRKQSLNSSNKSARVMTLVLMAVMLGGVLYAVNYINTNDLAPEDSSAAVSWETCTGKIPDLELRTICQGFVGEKCYNNMAVRCVSDLTPPECSKCYACSITSNKASCQSDTSKVNDYCFKYNYASGYYCVTDVSVSAVTCKGYKIDYLDICQQGEMCVSGQSRCVSGTPTPPAPQAECKNLPDSVWANAEGNYCFPDSDTLIYCLKDKTTVKTLDCSNRKGCITEEVGKADHCGDGSKLNSSGVIITVTPTPTGSNPAVTATPKPAVTTTPNPTTPVQSTPTPTPPSGKMQCGATGCKADSDCMTGLPAYECDESSVNWPNNNKCVKLCPTGQTKIDDCTCSGDVTAKVSCGKMDVDADGKLTYVDLSDFAKVYNKECGDTPPTVACGGKDVNSDGKINYIDLQSFSKRYHTVAANCSTI